MDQLAFWTHTVPLPPDPGSVARARDFVCAHLLVHSLPALVDDVRLVASELTTNAVQHAQAPLHLTLAREGHLVLLSVRDQAGGVPRLVDANASSPRGRGLTIVDRLSLEWGIVVAPDRTKTVWASFATGRTMAPDW